MQLGADVALDQVERIFFYLPLRAAALRHHRAALAVFRTAIAYRVATPAPRN
jgi:hypothetical protein